MAPVAAEAKPERIVSINLCTDHLLLRLAERGRIVSLTYLAADPHLSLIHGEIEGIPLNRGSAEELARLEPDLILAGTYGGRFGAALMKSLGYKVVEVAPAERIEDIPTAIVAVAEAIGEAERGEALAKSVVDRIAILAASAPGATMRAVVFQPRGFVAGPPSLAHDSLVLAGLTNAAADAGYGAWAPLGLERLLRLSPDLLVIDGAQRRGASLAHTLLAHPSLAAFARERPIVHVESAHWTCGVPETLDAVAMLRALTAREGGS